MPLRLLQRELGACLYFGFLPLKIWEQQATDVLSILLKFQSLVCTIPGSPEDENEPVRWVWGLQMTPSGSLDPSKGKLEKSWEVDFEAKKSEKFWGWRPSF